MIIASTAIQPRTAVAMATNIKQQDWNDCAMDDTVQFEQGVAVEGCHSVWLKYGESLRFSRLSLMFLNGVIVNTAPPLVS